MERIVSGAADAQSVYTKRRLTKKLISAGERQIRRDRARQDREAERRSLMVLHGMPLEPRVDPITLAERRAEMPDSDPRDLTARIFGDPNPADARRKSGQ